MSRSAPSQAQVGERALLGLETWQEGLREPSLSQSTGVVLRPGHTASVPSEAGAGRPCALRGAAPFTVRYSCEGPWGGGGYRLLFGTAAMSKGRSFILPGDAGGSYCLAAEPNSLRG